MDMDTAGARSGLIALLNDFEEQRIDILVGTQMVTKGLDFENVGFVGCWPPTRSRDFPTSGRGARFSVADTGSRQGGLQKEARTSADSGLRSEASGCSGGDQPQL
jgi:hypothetical protein